MNRRTLLKGVAGVVAGLMLPPTLEDNAEAARRFWALDQTMAPEQRGITFHVAQSYNPFIDTQLPITGPWEGRRGDIIEIMDYYPNSCLLDCSTREIFILADPLKIEHEGVGYARVLSRTALDAEGFRP